MKNIYLLLLILLHNLSFAQPGTEIYIFDLEKDGTGYTLTNPQNVTFQNPGYDNQPHFASKNLILYSSIREGQTDIAQMDFPQKSWSWLSSTEGSEYSPTPTPDGEGFSTILLEQDGTQLLWKYYFDQREPKILVPDLKIGYHCWFDENTIVAFVLGEPNTLQLYHPEQNKNTVVAKNIGRSLHKISQEQRVSYISKEGDNWKIMKLDPLSGEQQIITETLPGAEDIAWSPDGVIFMGSENNLYKFDPQNDTAWQKVADLEELELFGITRLAISPDGEKIAVVVNE